MEYILVPLDERAKSIIQEPCKVDKEKFYHYKRIYHGEFIYIINDIKKRKATIS